MQLLLVAVVGALLGARATVTSTSLCGGSGPLYHIAAGAGVNDLNAL